MPEPNTGCWIWLGPTFKGARPKLGVRGVSKLAYRLSHAVYKGPIPAGLIVCHRCDTPLCINPDHLWLGTHADNTADKMRKGRYRLGASRPRGCVYPTRSGKFRAQVRVSGRIHYLGIFASSDGASKAVAAFKTERDVPVKASSPIPLQPLNNRTQDRDQ
ncbi:HNH endonuclease [Mesorhizobium sp. BR1-1-9]|uniref:HNH endonuclease signature motif containing protein n=1 Tax=Mesorhizobium sp. BR1-1-9 TaxID=2876646 RepID=UPI001CD0DC67|nr:HNH endonuclease [Mesorhizobium sp. BR1-1-9]